MAGLAEAVHDRRQRIHIVGTGPVQPARTKVNGRLSVGIPVEVLAKAIESAIMLPISVPVGIMASMPLLAPGRRKVARGAAPRLSQPLLAMGPHPGDGMAGIAQGIEHRRRAAGRGWRDRHG